MLQDRRTSQDWKVARVLGCSQGKIVPGRGNSECPVAEDRTIGRPVRLLTDFLGYSSPCSLRTVSLSESEPTDMPRLARQ